MTLQRRDLPTIGVADIPEGEGRTQIAALCWRMDGNKPEILLITSRETGRWVLPKGWPMKDISAADAAAQEAWEEAGVEGKVQDNCIGLYAYHKVLGDETDVPCIVAVYPLKVKALHDKFPEAAERKRSWFAPGKAAARVDEPELRDLIARFDPKALKG
jgi:8-oxo-dGTP pyrophosphatase MutT (NUDIX family)